MKDKQYSHFTAHTITPYHRILQLIQIDVCITPIRIHIGFQCQIQYVFVVFFFVFLRVDFVAEFPVGFCGLGGRGVGGGGGREFGSTDEFGANEPRVHRRPGGGGGRRALPSAFQNHAGPRFPAFSSSSQHSGREGEEETALICVLASGLQIGRASCRERVSSPV